MAGLFLHDACAAFTASGGRDVNLGVAIVRIAPAPTFKQTVRCSDAAKGYATGKTAARIDHAASRLTDVQSLPARMLT